MLSQIDVKNLPCSECGRNAYIQLVLISLSLVSETGTVDVKFTLARVSQFLNFEERQITAKSFEKFMGTPIGAAKKPLSQNMLFEKFNSCIQYSGVSKSAEKIYNKLLNIEKIENCRELYKV